MEPPESWDLQTASLAVLDLQRPFAAWAFLVLQGLVRDTPGDREAFADAIREEVARRPVTGPSLACRVAGSLAQAGIALPMYLYEPNADHGFANYLIPYECSLQEWIQAWRGGETKGALGLSG